MRPRSDLDAADARAAAIARNLTIARLNWGPRPDVRSVGQCLEHLCISNEVYIGPIADSPRRNPFVPWIRFTVGTGLQIIARHNHRHLLQAERVKELSHFPDRPTLSNGVRGSH